MDKIVFTNPAKYFEEAFPVGNGFFGGMYYGDAERGKLSLNLDSLWSGNGKNKGKGYAADRLEKVRKASRDGKPGKAAKLLRKYFYGDDSEAYVPLGNLHIIAGSGERENYIRELDFERGTVFASYSEGGAQVKEECFCSNPHMVLALKIHSDKAVLSRKVDFEPVQYCEKIYGENDGVRARRSPGSTLKPLIYATAVDMGFIHSMTLLRDAKINFGVYAPENSDSEFFGPVLARDALTHSRNIPAINLLRRIGVKNFYNILAASGVTNLKSPDYYGISVALGGAEVSMFELADIYATMANLGLRRDIRTDTRTQTNDGAQILSPEAFFITLDMLAHQSTPTKNIPFSKQQPQSIRHYWKTGTSSSYRDAWTAGIFGDFVLIVWVGNFDGTPNNAFSGARAAAPIYFALADATQKYYATRNAPIKNNNFLRDDMNISTVEMCDGVGGLAGKYCPKTVTAYFIPGKSPITTSSVYRAVPVDNNTGLRACNRDPKTTHMEIFEFWDSEYLDMFARAGITRNTPPPFMPGCDLDAITSTRAAPVVMSPIDGTRTVILSDGDTQPIAFRAVSDMTDAKIFWFLNDEMIGTTVSGETLMHDTPIGDYTVRIMDEMGAATTIKFSVVK